MKSVQIEFSEYESVNFLWSELIEDYGFDKAKKNSFSSHRFAENEWNKKYNNANYIFRNGRFSLSTKKSLKKRVF